MLARVGTDVSHIVSFALVLSETFCDETHMRKVDFAASAEMHRTVVNAGVDERLDEIKRRYDGIENLLDTISRDIATTIPGRYSLELNVIFFPQIGFLISMPSSATAGQTLYEGGGEEDQRWERIFSTDSRIYYKDRRMRELDGTIGDLYAVICGMPRC